MEEPKEKDVSVNYETLFEILRIEKSKEELQKLDEGFFIDVISYLKDRYTSIETASPEEKKKKEEELDNIKDILKKLYERREKKIVSLALDVSRTKSNLIDRSGLLSEERELFDALIDILDNGRENILDKVLNSSVPDFKAPEKNTGEKENKEEGASPGKEELPEKKDAPAEETRTPEEKEKKETPETGKEDNNSDEEDDAQPKESKTKMIRFISAVPKFVGKELEEYGPFEDEDVASLPAEIANVLIDKGRAEEIQQG